MRALLLIGSAAGALGAGALAVYLWRRKTQAPARKMSAETVQKTLVKDPSKPISKVPPVRGMSRHDLAKTANSRINEAARAKAGSRLRIVLDNRKALVASRYYNTEIGKFGGAIGDVASGGKSIGDETIRGESIKSFLEGQGGAKATHDKMRSAFLELNHMIRIAPGASTIGYDYADPWRSMSGDMSMLKAQYLDTQKGEVVNE